MGEIRQPVRHPGHTERMRRSAVHDQAGQPVHVPKEPFREARAGATLSSTFSRVLLINPYPRSMQGSLKVHRKLRYPLSLVLRPQTAIKSFQKSLPGQKVQE